MYRITQLSSCLFGVVLAVAAFAGPVCADEHPSPLWDPAQWNGQPWADEATQKHLSLFLRSSDARRQCKGDAVEWLDRSNGYYYGATTHRFHVAQAGPRGYFVCRAQAERIGARPSPTER